MYDTFDDKFLICPYCGHKEKVDLETFVSNFGTDPDCTEEHECPECGKIYKAHRMVFIHYETNKIEEN